MINRLLIVAFMGSTFALHTSDSELWELDPETEAMWDKAEKKMSKERKFYLKEEARKCALIAYRTSKGPHFPKEIQQKEYRLFSTYLVEWQVKLSNTPSLFIKTEQL